MMSALVAAITGRVQTGYNVLQSGQTQKLATHISLLNVPAFKAYSKGTCVRCMTHQACQQKTCNNNQIQYLCASMSDVS